MIYAGPDFLAVLWFVSFAHPPSFPLTSCLSFSAFLYVGGRAYWQKLGGEGRGGAKSFDGEKAWSTTDHSMLSEALYVYKYTTTYN